MSDPTTATPSVRFSLRRLSPALLLSLGALACRPTIESDKSIGDLYGEDSGGADGADGATDTGGEDTGEDTGDDIDIAPPVIYDCDTAPTTDFTGTPTAGARAYHGIGFDDVGHLIGWDGRSALIKATYEGDREVFLPGINYAEQIDRLPDGDFVMGDPYAGTLVRISPEGASTVLASGVSGVYGVTVGPDGNVYVANGGVVRVETATGTVTTLLNAPPDGGWIAHSIEFNLDSTVLYIGTIGSGQLLGLPLDEDLNPSGEPTTLATVGSGWHDAVAVDACGMLWIPDYYSSGFYRVDLEAGTVTNAVPTGGVAYGHGAVFGTGINGWRRDAIYQPQPYNGSTVREVVIGVPTGDTVRTWRGDRVSY